MSGRTRVHLISDGTFKIDGGVLFGQVPKSTWQDWMSADRRNRVKLNLNCLLVRVGERNYLVDTGAGAKHSAEDRDALGLSTSQLLSELKSHDLTPADIHGVVLTSLHFEHTGGCTRTNRRGEFVPTFPKATYFVQREALEEAISPTDRHVNGYVPNDYNPLVDSKKMELVDGEVTIVPGLQVRRASGPYQGHQIVVITHGGERVAFLGDLVPTHHHLQPDCIAASDRHPEETLTTKYRVLDEAVDDGWLLVFSHGTDRRAGYLEQRGNRRSLRTISLD